jgi:hypothetical protein
MVIKLFAEFECEWRIKQLMAELGDHEQLLEEAVDVAGRPKVLQPHEPMGALHVHIRRVNVRLLE